jgi:hypothetical protein
VLDALANDIPSWLEEDYPSCVSKHLFEASPLVMQENAFSSVEGKDSVGIDRLPTG